MSWSWSQRRRCGVLCARECGGGSLPSALRLPPLEEGSRRGASPQRRVRRRCLEGPSLGHRRGVGRRRPSLRGTRLVGGALPRGAAGPLELSLWLGFGAARSPLFQPLRASCISPSLQSCAEGRGREEEGGRTEAGGWTPRWALALSGAPMGVAHPMARPHAGRQCVMCKHRSDLRVIARFSSWLRTPEA